MTPAEAYVVGIIVHLVGGALFLIAIRRDDVHNPAWLAILWPLVLIAAVPVVLARLLRLVLENRRASPRAALVIAAGFVVDAGPVWPGMAAVRRVQQCLQRVRVPRATARDRG